MCRFCCLGKVSFQISINGVTKATVLSEVKRFGGTRLLLLFSFSMVIPFHCYFTVWQTGELKSLSSLELSRRDDK